MFDFDPFIIVYILVPVFWLIMAIWVPKILSKTTFKDKENQGLVRFAHFVVYVLFIDSCLWGIPNAVVLWRKSTSVFFNIPDWIENLTGDKFLAISRFLVLVSGVLFYFFLHKSGQAIRGIIQNLKKANANTEHKNSELLEANKSLESISMKIEALVDFGKELNTKIYAGEAAIQEFIQEKADNFMNTDNMYIAMYDEVDEVVNFPVFLKDGLRSKIPSRKAGHGRTEAIIDTGESILIHNKQESQDWYEQPGRKEYIGDELSSWIGVPMKNHEDKVMGVVATYHPVLDNLYDEDDLRVLESMADLAVIAIENARLVERLKTVQNEIAERERELVTSGFAMDFTHKINNLIGPMKPWLHLLTRRLSEESSKNERVKKIIGRIGQDIGLVLNEAKLLRQPMTDPEYIDLESLIMGILGQVELMANENVFISFSSEEKIPEVYGVRQPLSAAIYSIIQNGLKALHNGGNLSVRLSKGDVENQKYVYIIIKDDGVGIEKQRREIIFEFGITEWKHARGTGYGLWRARNVIQNYGGSLQLTYTEVNKGTEFTIALPVPPEKNQV